MSKDLFPWHAVYKALVRRICEINEEDLSEMLLRAEVGALAKVHSEVLVEGGSYLNKEKVDE